MRHILLLLVFLASLLPGEAKPVVWFDGLNAVTVCRQRNMDPVVETALEMFAEDMRQVTGVEARKVYEGRANILLFQLDKADIELKKQLHQKGVKIQMLSKSRDGFAIAVSNGAIIVAGSNGRGVAYGLLELSRLAGVSPWIWWGDVEPERRWRLTIDDKYNKVETASVEYRGIFLNDEDWSLREWSSKTYEPGPKGQIGPKTYRRIFELLLRLRANAIWPAMHPGTKPFFLTPGAKAEADRCGIVIGTSHCEPMLRNNVGEWNEKQRGRFNYITNRQAVKDYWAERLVEVRQSGNNMFTIGMRGIHDGNMEGVSTDEEKLRGLQQVIDDQQDLLRQHIGEPSQLTQVFVPYKEVLQIYENGLRVPDYVTLMWCDDNYGYLTRMSTPQEQKRKGGAGVYYHLSYWGRPHDYLWLTTTQPGLIYNEMREAYNHNVRKLWIANVHDPKVAGYDLELFLDMAWNINCVKNDRVDKHYHAWLQRTFGKDVAEKIYPAMQTFYRLVGQRRPEFMGWSQVELDKKRFERGLSPIQDTEFSHEFGDEMMQYLHDYKEIADTVSSVYKLIPRRLRKTYRSMIEYPVVSASLMAKKILYAQKARELASDPLYGQKEEVKDSIMLFSGLAHDATRRILSLTHALFYTNPPEKWNRLMDFAPRKLPVFGMPPLPVKTSEIKPLEGTMQAVEDSLFADLSVAEVDYSYISSASIPHSYVHLPEGARRIPMLGHSMKAISIPKGKVLTYQFYLDKKQKNALLRLALIPTQPNDGGDLRFAVSVDGGKETIFSLKEPFRSEQWKLNVLRGQAVRELPLSLKKGPHHVSIRAIDDHIVLDQWLLDFKKDRRYYLFPQE